MTMGPTWHELGVKEAYKEMTNEAIRAHKYAAVLRLNANPDLQAGASHYEFIGEMWTAHASRLLDANPIPSEEGAQDA